jgi:hypothetical protein
MKRKAHWPFYNKLDEKIPQNVSRMPARRRVRGGMPSTLSRAASGNLPPTLDLSPEPALDSHDQELPEDKNEASSQYFIAEQNITIRVYSNISDRLMLQTLQPEYIIMYNANPSFIRQVEVI